MLKSIFLFLLISGFITLLVGCGGGGTGGVLPDVIPTTTPTVVPPPSGAQIVVNEVPSGGSIEAQVLDNLGNNAWVEFSPSEKSEKNQDDHRYQLSGLPDNSSSLPETDNVCYINDLTADSFYTIRVKDSAGTVIDSRFLQLEAGSKSFDYETLAETADFRLFVTEQTNTSTEILNNLLRCNVIIRSVATSYSSHSDCKWKDFYDEKGWYLDLAGFPVGNATVEVILYDKFGNEYSSATQSFEITGASSEITIPITDWGTKNLGITETQADVRHDYGELAGSSWYMPVSSPTSDLYFWEKTGGYEFDASGLKVKKVHLAFDSNNPDSSSKVFRTDVIGDPGNWYRREVLEKDTRGGENNIINIIFTAEAGTVFTSSELLPPGYRGGVTISSVEIWDVSTATLGSPEYK